MSELPRQQILDKDILALLDKNLHISALCIKWGAKYSEMRSDLEKMVNEIYEKDWSELSINDGTFIPKDCLEPIKFEEERILKFIERTRKAAHIYIKWGIKFNHIKQQLHAKMNEVYGLDWEQLNTSDATFLPFSSQKDHLLFLKKDFLKVENKKVH